MRKIFTFIVATILCASIYAQEEGTTYEPISDQNTYFDISKPLRDIDPIPPKGADGHHKWKNGEVGNLIKEKHLNNLENALPKYEDPAWQKTGGTKGITPPIVNFQGVRNSDNASGVAPPDTDGDVGPNHYFQMCNVVFEIFDKSGTSLYGPADNSTIWDGFIGDWTGTNDGDPITLYDEQADRWLITQFAVNTVVTGGTYWVLCAVSTSSDPLGSYYRYAFEYASFPDYPKFGIWRDGYYLMVQHGTAIGEVTASALNRSQMIAGNPTAQRVSFAMPNLPGGGFIGMLPADNDGDWAPIGSPNYFMYFSDDAWGDDPVDRLKIWEFDVNWTSPWLSTLTLTQNLNTDPFDSYFGGFNTGFIDQPVTSNNLRVMHDAMMNRLNYRNFGTHESMVVCHTVERTNGSADAAVRWYELRKTTGSWYIYQQSTYGPTSDSYWMASIAINGDGDIALGYSVSSGTTYPSIRYTGRNPEDPLGQMTFEEQSIFEGSHYQTGTERWGDYSRMNVDPSDDETFWYTNEYLSSSTIWGSWVTQIASFNLGDYCHATATNTNYEHISNVTCGSINNTTGSDGYMDYTNLSTTVPINSSETVTVTNGPPNYSDNYCGIWIDWNRDGDFDDTDETLTVSGTPGNGPYSATIDPPATATLGECTMRIRISYATPPLACGIQSFGEVEDYTINVGSHAPNYWTGAFNYYWHNAGNWSLGHIPTADETVYMTTAGYHPPSTGSYSDECNNLIIEAGAGLIVSDQTLTIHNDLTVYGNIEMSVASATVTVEGNTIWGTGSTATISDYNTYFNAYGNWNFDPGSNVNLNSGFVNFHGTSDCWVRTYSANSSFNNLRVYKSGGAAVKLSNLCTEDLVVNNLIYTASGSAFNSLSNENIVINGSFNYYGTFDFTLNSNTGSTVFEGSTAAFNNYSSGSGTHNNVVFSTTGTTTGYSDLQVLNNITIEDGTFNAGATTVSLGGDWTNNGGSFTPGTSTVIFTENGVDNDVNGPAIFYNVQQTSSSNYLRFNGVTTINNNLDLPYFCWAYQTFNVNGTLNIDNPSSKFTANGSMANATIANLDQGGTIFCNGAATLTINDLTESYILGTYYANDPGGVINLSNNGSAVDLGGDLIINGGTMNISGSISWWPYNHDASITMTDGILDIIGCDIYIYNTATYALTDNITGGTIRTDHGFSGNRADFTPSAGTFEFYGGITEYISQTNGCTLPYVVIDKLAPSKISSFPAIQQIDDGREDKNVSDSKSPDIFLSSNFVVTNYLTVNSGSLTLNGYTLTVANDVDIYGTLNMTNALDILNVGTGAYDNLAFGSGSLGNLTAGVANLASWIWIQSGGLLSATTGNTINFNGPSVAGIEVDEIGSVFGNINVISASPFRLYDVGGIPIEVDGNFDLQAGNTIDFQDRSMIVHGNFTDTPTSIIYIQDGPVAKGGGELSAIDPTESQTSKLSAEIPNKSGTKGGAFELDNSFTLNGLMDVGDGDVLLHGGFSIASTGTMNIDGGSVIDDAPLGTDIWHYINGSLNITSGLFEISNNSINFGASSVNAISGGTIRAGAFYANNAGTFLPTGGFVETIGSTGENNIFCSNGNYFYDLLINRQTGYAAWLQTDIIIQNDLTISSGVLNTNNYNIDIGGNWTNNVGTTGFLESTSTVTFNGTGDVDLIAVGGQNFNNLTIDKGAVGNVVGLMDNIDVAGDIVVNTGALYSNNNNILVDGNVIINAAGFLYIMSNGTLGVGDGMSLDVNNGGYLYAVGTSGNPATITHASTGNYNFNIYSGALMGAQHALFDYMTSNGVFLRVGSLVHSTWSFNYCTFQNGTPGYPTLFNIATNESFTSVGANFPDAGSATYNVYKYSGSTGQTTFQDATGAFAGEAFDYDPNNFVDWIYTTRTLDLTVFLEGPYNGSTNKMDLGLNSMLPLDQPFDTPPLSNPSPDWFYTGTESVGAIPNPFIVDWVLVELRDATSPATALPGTAIFTQAAFVTNTGNIVDLDGVSPLTFTGTIINNLYAVVWTRNHLGIISANPLVDAGGIYTYDFSSGSGQAYGGTSAQHQLSISPAIWGIIPGDANATGLVAIGDKTNVWWLQAGIKGYLESDYDYDGEADNIDKNDFWFPNMGDASFIPE